MERSRTDPLNRLSRVMKHYSPTGRRNHGRPLKRLLDTWYWNGSTSGPTPWQIYDDDDDIAHLYPVFIKHCNFGNKGHKDVSASKLTKKIFDILIMDAWHEMLCLPGTFSKFITQQTGNFPITHRVKTCSILLFSWTVWTLPVRSHLTGTWRIFLYLGEYRMWNCEYVGLGVP